MLRDSEQLVFDQTQAMTVQDARPADVKYPFIEEDDVNEVEKEERLTKALDHKLINKQNLVAKNGKGKFNVTVPILFEFQKYPNEKKSMR